MVVLGAWKDASLYLCLIEKTSRPWGNQRTEVQLLHGRQMSIGHLIQCSWKSGAVGILRGKHAAGY